MKTVIGILCFCLLFAPWVHAQERFVLNADDRILVIAPHPDDETIGAAGVMQEAIKQNIPVEVVYLTNGDSNPLAFLYYKKYPLIGKTKALRMGELRQAEAVAAMDYLGLKKDRLVFLGYPDYGTLRIFKKYWGASQSYRATITRAERVPYALSLSPGAPYNGQSILDDIKKVLLEFKPTKVFVTHPADMNEDHQAAYLFLKVALWDLKGTLGDVGVHTYFVHAVGWPRPMGLHPQVRLESADYLDFQGDLWMDFALTAQQVSIKEKAIAFYRSQIPYKPNFLYTFVRANELFARVDDLAVPAVLSDAHGWGALEKEQATCLAGGCANDRRARFLRSVVYARTPQELIIRVKFNHLAPGLNIGLFIFGYRDDVPFAQMPKLRVELDRELRPTVFDGKTYLRNVGLKVFRSGNDVFVSVPGTVLKDPQKMMGAVHVRINNLPLENSAWSILELEHGS